MNLSRRQLLRRGSIGLGTAGFFIAGGQSLLLGADVPATDDSGDLGAFREVLKPDPSAPARADRAAKAKTDWSTTLDNILGPYFRAGAPYRAKITPPMSAGTVLLVSGRVWGVDTRRPLAGCLLDIWQANADGRYDNDDPQRPPTPGVFVNRARIVTDETGYYEYETVHPGAYQTGPDTWRPSHIHYLVRHPGYRPLITQLYFKGDPRNAADAFIKPSLIIEVAHEKVRSDTYEVGAFDVVLAKR